MPSVGKPIPHDSADGHVTGTAPYIDDIPPRSDELFVGFVGSPVASGRIETIDTAAAQLALTPIRMPLRNLDEIARAINIFAAEANGGLLITGAHPDENIKAILELALQHRLPTMLGTGKLVAEGLARSQDLTGEGVKIGLEQVKWLAAAEGEEGTLLGFGIQDRGALHGRYLVLRQWVNGKTVEV